MGNLLPFKAMIRCETAKNKTQLHRALQRIEALAAIALNAGKIVGIDLKELEEPKFEKPKDRTALGLDPVGRFKDT